jgi:hypothetical protein
MLLIVWYHKKWIVQLLLNKKLLEAIMMNRINKKMNKLRPKDLVILKTTNHNTCHHHNYRIINKYMLQTNQSMS